MLRGIIRAAFGGMLAALSFAMPAAAENVNFSSPMQGSDRLDWCYDWGVGCGAQAANAWCVNQGFTGAAGFDIAHDIGASTRTRLVGTGAVCDQGFCDGFAYITCSRPDPTQRFNSPTYSGNRLDWCFNWGVGCGQQAADAFCQAAGFVRAVDLAIQNDIGTSTPTRLIGTGAICDQGFCDGFAYITCSH